MEESRHGGLLGKLCHSNHMVRDAMPRKQSIDNTHILCNHQRLNFASRTNKLAEPAFHVT